MVTRFEPPTERLRGSWWSFAEWMTGIVGGLATFLGLFIYFGSDTRSIGLGGEWSWTVGEIDPMWAYGFMIGGVVLLAATWWMVTVGRERTPAAATPTTILAQHTVIFALVNAIVWLQDYAMGDGLDYALWLTVPWGVALLAHAWYAFRDEGSTTIAPRHREALHH